MCYIQGNYERMCQELKQINFAHEFSPMNVESAVFHFYMIMNKILVIGNVPKIKILKNSRKPKC